MKKLALAASLASIAVVGLAHAAETQMNRPDMNRTVTRAEAMEHANQMFDRMDVNKDGKLDAADREARRAAMFDRIDTNKDGSISRAEFTAIRPHGGMQHEGMKQEGGNHGGMMGHHMRRRGMMGHMMLRMADSDRDGAVTKAEFTAAATTHYDRVDANHDGQITPAERQAAHAAMREEMQRRHASHGADGAPPVPAD